MRRLLLLLGVLSVAPLAAQDDGDQPDPLSIAPTRWVQLTRTGGATVSVDLEGILRRYPGRVVWELHRPAGTVRTAQGQEYDRAFLSVEYDCFEFRRRHMRTRMAMGSRQVASTQEDRWDWQPVRPGSPYRPVLERVCAAGGATARRPYPTNNSSYHPGWLSAGLGRNDEFAYVDWAAAQRQGTQATGWISWSWGQPRTLPGRGTYRTRIDRVRADCTTNRFQRLQSAFLDVTREVGTTATASPAWEEAPRGTKARDAVELLCTPPPPPVPWPVTLPESRWAGGLRTQTDTVDLDLAGASTLGGHPMMWRRWSYGSPQRLYGVNGTFDRAYALIRVDCAGGRTQTLRQVRTRGAQVVDSTTTVDTWSDPARPGSIAEGYVRAACGQGQAAASRSSPVPSVPDLPHPGPNEELRWSHAGMSDSLSLYVAWQGLRDEGSYKLGWIRFRYLGRRTTSAGQSYNRLLELNRFDCAGRRMQPVRAVYFDDAVNIRSAEMVPDWYSPNTGSLGEGLLEMACTPAAPAWPVPSALPESRWTSLGLDYGEYGPMVSIDRQSRVRIGEHWYLWVRYAERGPRNMIDGGAQYDTRYVIARVDCGRRRFQALRHHYLLNGRPVQTDERPWSWSDDMRPQRGNARVTTAACS